MRRKVRSASEAHDIHETHFAWLLASARTIAVSIAREKGTAHTRVVREALVDYGIMQEVPPNEAEERWLGTLFRDRLVWEKTGEKVPRHSEVRNTHRGSEGVNVWRIRPGADLSRYADPPPLPPGVTLPIRPGRRVDAGPAADRPNGDLPFNPAAALRDIARLRKMSAMHGDREGDDFVKLVKWLEGRAA